MTARCCRIGADGAVADIASFGMKWVEHVASFADDKARAVACAVGKLVHLFDGAGATAEDAGASLDRHRPRVRCEGQARRRLALQRRQRCGSSPPRPTARASWNGRAATPASPSARTATRVVTAMQENALHGWRLSDGQHMRMSGYPGEDASRCRSPRAASGWPPRGADAIVLWPFFGGGPMGKAPMELAGGDGVICTARRRATRSTRSVAGRLRRRAGGAGRYRLVAHPAGVRPGPRPDLRAGLERRTARHLAFGTETGFAAIVDFSKR